jgi:hypothetical protein
VKIQKSLNSDNNEMKVPSARSYRHIYIEIGKL